MSTIRRQVRGAMEIAVFIQNIQEERAEVALYIFTNQTNNIINKSMVNMNTKYSFDDVNNPNRNRGNILLKLKEKVDSRYLLFLFFLSIINLISILAKKTPNRNRMGIQERFSQTDRALEEVPTWPNVSSRSLSS